jgi:hypothetical protein
VAMESTVMPRLLEMACSGVSWMQSLAVDILAQAASHKKGRPLFGNLVETEAGWVESVYSECLFSVTRVSA